MKQIPYFTLLLFSLFVLASCNKEEENLEKSMEEEEAAEVMESAMTVDAEGLAREAEEAALAAQTYALESYCGLSGDTTFSRNVSNAFITASYSTTWDWQLTCQGPIPSIYFFGRETEGNYETNRMISVDTAFSDWSVSNLVTGNAYLLSGLYGRSGSQESKIGQQNSFNSNLEVVVTEIAVDKTTFEILSGEGTFVLTGQGSGGTDVTYTGEITFNGGNSVTITLNGQSYTFSW